MAKSLGLTRRLISLDNFIDSETGRARRINSPRSLESCLRQGIDPSELKPIKVDVFIQEEQELTGLKEVVVCKFEHYEERRQEKLMLARQERDLIIGYLEEAARTGVVSPQAKKFMKLAGAQDDTSGELTDAQKMALAEAQAAESSMLEEEKRRVIAMKKRQQKEIEQMMDFEMGVAKMQAEQRRLQELDAKKQAARAKEREQKKKRAIEKRRQKDLARAAREQQEEEERAEAARRDYIFEQKRKKMMLQQEKELKRQAKVQEEQRILAKLERAKQLKAIQDAQEEEIAKKMMAMKLAEKKRKERTAAENAARLAAGKAKKAEA